MCNTMIWKKKYVFIFCVFMLFICTTSCERTDVIEEICIKSASEVLTRTLSNDCEVYFGNHKETELEQKMTWDDYFDIEILFNGKGGRVIKEANLYLSDKAIGNEWKVEDAINVSDFSLETDSIWTYKLPDLTVYKGGKYDIWAKIKYEKNSSEYTVTSEPIYYTYLYPDNRDIENDLKGGMEYEWDIFTSTDTDSYLDKNSMLGCWLYCRGHYLEVGLRETMGYISDSDVTEYLPDAKISFSDCFEPDKSEAPFDVDAAYVVGYFHTGLIMGHRPSTSWRHTGPISFDMGLVDRSSFELPIFIWDYTQSDTIHGGYPRFADSQLYVYGNERRNCDRNNDDITSFFK